MIGKVREASGGVKKLNLLWENFRNLRKFKENEHIGMEGVWKLNKYYMQMTQC